MRRYEQRENSGVVSVIGLGLVVLSIPLTLWWWTHAVWGNVSLDFLNNVAPYIGYSSAPEHPLVTSEAAQPQGAAQAARGAVSAASADVSAPVSAGAFCPAGQTAQFVLGFAQLKERVGDAMGQPLECEHQNPVNGDTLQQTTTGLAVYQPSKGSLQFTDGWHHWELSAGRLTTWDGQDQPPVASTSTPQVALDPSAIARLAAQQAPAATQPDAQTLGRIVNTDGQGVVLRSAPRADARMPRGLLEGAQVEVLDHSGADWVHVRGVANGEDGWIPAQYLQVQSS